MSLAVVGASVLVAFYAADDPRPPTVSLAPLLQRIWELRDNLTAYDAA